MRRAPGFTLIEIAICCFILMIIMLLALPSVEGVLKNRRLQRSLDQMNNMVREAQQRSVHERRPYLIVWQKDAIILRPEAFNPGEEATPDDTIVRDKYHGFALKLPAALEKNPLPQWIFWPSGTCEPANVSFQGPDGSWEVDYPPLTARAQIVRYAAR